MSQAPSNPTERRRFRRSVVGIPIHAVRQEAPQNDPHRLIGLHILNVSLGGVGAVSQESLEHRESLTLLFPPLGPGRGQDTVAKVIRCDRAGDGFAVGIAFEEPWPEREEAKA
ncbi:MAG: PilZ domain-containing protein [Planctomycetota bacterium]|nr:PilZ domain-containing protein [Planctomycetota bacterium]